MEKRIEEIREKYKNDLQALVNAPWLLKEPTWEDIVAIHILLSYISEFERKVKELEERITVLELPARNYNKTLIRAEQAEARLKLEEESVNELSLALQDSQNYLNQVIQAVEKHIFSLLQTI